MGMDSNFILIVEQKKIALDKQLGGIMFWRLNGDTYNNGLLDAIYQQIGSSSRKNKHK